MDEQTPQPTVIVNPRPRFTAKHKKAFAVAIGVVILIAVALAAKSFLIAAMVDGVPISRLKVIEELERQGGQGVLDSLITERLVLDEAKEKGVTVTDQELEDELTILKDGVTQMGGTFEAALAERGFTEDSLRHGILVQLTLKKLVADIIVVTNEDIDQYILESEIEISEEESAQFRESLQQQLQEEKFSQEAPGFIEKLRAEADIEYLVNY